MFKCQDYFMIRSPFLPYRYLVEFNEQSDKDIYEYIKSSVFLNNFFKNALLISSISLYNSYINKPLKKKKYNILVNSLLKYFIRATTRATPFGLFSSVSMGSFSDFNIIGSGNYIHDIRIDSEWIRKVISKIEVEYIEELLFKFNNNTYIIGDRIKNPHYTNNFILNNDKKFEEIDVKNTDLVKYIKSISTNEIKYLDMKNAIFNKYSNVPEEKVTNFIREIYFNEYIYSNLRLPPYCEDPLKYLIETLKKYSLDCKVKYFKDLVEISSLLDSYKENLDVHLLEKLYAIMSKLYENKNYIVFNLGKEYDKFTLQKEIKSDIENFMNIIYKLPLKYNDAKSFKESFVNKYGYNVLVSLITLLENKENLKLNDLSVYNSFSNNKQEEKIKKIFYSKIIKAIINKDSVVYFKEEDFDDVKTNEEYEKSLDLNLMISTSKEKNTLYLGAGLGSSQAGLMFQRFSEVLNQEKLSKYNNIYISENYLDYINVEIREQNKNSRNNNVINNKNNYTYYINLGNYQYTDEYSININDIFLCLDSNNKFQWYSNKHKKKIKFVTDNMLNHNHYSFIARLLLNISCDNDYYPEHRIFNMEEYLDLKYLPSIKIGNIFVNTRTWILDESDLKTDNYNIFKDLLLSAIVSYKIERKVYYKINDNKLLISFDDDKYIYILYREFVKYNKLKFVAIESHLYENLVEQNGYLYEYVFSLKNEVRKNVAKKEVVNNTKEFISSIKTLFQDGWVYFKLYYNHNRANDILAVELPNILKKLYNKNHFFIRYSDSEGDHIRLRFKFTKKKKQDFQKILAWVNKLQSSNIINKFVIDQYDREVNRYGGLLLINFVENHFFKNSELVEMIIANYYKNDDSNLEDMYLVGILNILFSLTYDINEALEIIISSNNKEGKEYFRNNRNKLLLLVEEVSSGKYPTNVLSEFYENTKTLEIIKENISNLITTNKKDFVLSIIHMYCNRLTGLNYLEDKYLSIISITLEYILNKNKNFEIR